MISYRPICLLAILRPHMMSIKYVTEGHFHCLPAGGAKTPQHSVLLRLPPPQDKEVSITELHTQVRLG